MTTPSSAPPPEQSPERMPEQSSASPAALPPEQSPRPRVWAVLADERLPGFRGLSPKQRAAYATVAVAAVVVSVLLAYQANLLLDWLTATDRARSNRQAEETVDRERPAFVSTVTPLDHDQYIPEAVAILLDRPLTEDEQATLTAMNGNAPQVWEFLKPLGGRVVEHPTGPVGSDEHGPENRGEAQTFDLNLNSDRVAGLTINNMTAVKDSCRAPTAQTVVNIPPAGSGPRQGLLWDLTGGPTDKPYGPYILDEGESQGELYFRRNVVELGNGQSNMAFRIQPEVSTHTCEWHIVASYTDTTGSHEQRIPSGTGVFTTEAIPLQPVQYFERVPGTGWGCIGKMSQKGCSATEFVRLPKPPQRRGPI
ncbi:hypothetical protein GCM10027280_40610 [Micromonospora polyrhachis]